MLEATRSCKESVPYLPCKIIRRKHGSERVRAASKPFPAQTEAFEFGWTATPLTLNGASVLFNNAADGTNANQCYCLTPAAPVTWTAEACGSPWCLFSLRRRPLLRPPVFRTTRNFSVVTTKLQGSTWPKTPCVQIQNSIGSFVLGVLVVLCLTVRSVTRREG